MTDDRTTRPRDGLNMTVQAIELIGQVIMHELTSQRKLISVSSGDLVSTRVCVRVCQLCNAHQRLISLCREQNGTVQRQPRVAIRHGTINSSVSLRPVALASTVLNVKTSYFTQLKYVT